MHRRRADRGELLHHDSAEAQVVLAASAVLLGDADAEDALMARRPPDRAVHLVLLLPALLVRSHLTCDERADHGAERFVVLVVQAAFHRVLLRLISAGSVGSRRGTTAVR